MGKKGETKELGKRGRGDRGRKKEGGYARMAGYQGKGLVEKERTAKWQSWEGSACLL